MQHKLQLALVLGVAAGIAHAQSFSPAPDIAAQSTTMGQPAGGPAMHKLATSAQRLRDAIQLMADKPAGPERDAAIAQAQAALRATQVAMADLPRAPQGTAPASSGTAGYDTSVRALMAAADALRDSIHTIARRPAGPERNQAIREADRALMQTQVAMADAYDATSHPQRTNVLGSGRPARQGTRTITIVSDAHCARLDTMWACKP